MTGPSAQHRTLRIGHSPDPDDAFMWYPLVKPAIDTGPYTFIHVLEDIQSLNRRSENGELEITALSIHQYPYVADKYALTSCGSSMGDGYGPMVVSRKKMDLRDLITPQTTPERGKRKPRIAIPGDRTTAALAFQLRLLEEGVQPGAETSIDYELVMFDQIIDAVVDEEYDAGLIIHEGQLTYEESGLHCVVDLGKWWKQTRGLPLPLGGNAIRRDLGSEMPTICGILLESIRYALAHRKEAVTHAMKYARDMGAEQADQFVGMYVNDYTLDYGDKGRAAVTQLLKEGADAGIIPAIGEIDFVNPA